MLITKFSYISNISSNATHFATSSSTIPNSLFEMMKNNILIVENINGMESKGNEEKIDNEV